MRIAVTFTALDLINLLKESPNENLKTLASTFLIVCFAATFAG